MDKQLLLEELKNAIFPSKENDGIEHVDMSYELFIHKLEQLAGIGLPETETKPVGQATVVDDYNPIESFPNHDENITNE